MSSSHMPPFGDKRSDVSQSRHAASTLQPPPVEPSKKTTAAHAARLLHALDDGDGSGSAISALVNTTEELRALTSEASNDTSHAALVRNAVRRLDAALSIAIETGEFRGANDAPSPDSLDARALRTIVMLPDSDITPAGEAILDMAILDLDAIADLASGEHHGAASPASVAQLLGGLVARLRLASELIAETRRASR